MKTQNRIKKIAALALAGVMAAGLTACGGSASGGETIRVGSKDFTESLVVSEIYALALENAGYKVERKQDIAGSVVHTSLINNEIDLYPEYTGTGLLSILQMDMITDPEEVYRTVKDEYEKRFSVTWLDYSKANDGQGLVIRTDVAKQPELRFASQGEFDAREDGLPALENKYGTFDWKSSRVYDGGLKYEVLLNGEADVAPAYTTEGQLAEKDKFMLLEDDKQVWPPYNLAPVVRDDTLAKNPEIADILNKISASLDTDTVTALNAEVDVDKREYEEVAREYYDTIK